jgi:hypothetical protein
VLLELSTGCIASGGHYLASFAALSGAWFGEFDVVFALHEVVRCPVKPVPGLRCFRSDFSLRGSEKRPEGCRQECTGLDEWLGEDGE